MVDTHSKLQQSTDTKTDFREREYAHLELCWRIDWYADNDLLFSYEALCGMNRLQVVQEVYRF